MNYTLHKTLQALLEGRSQTAVARDTSMGKGTINKWANRPLREPSDYRGHPRDEARLKSLRALLPDEGLDEEAEVHIPDPNVDYDGGTASCSFVKPVTVDEAIEYLEIDETRWTIVRPKVGTYEGQVKVDVITGYDDEGEPIIEQQHKTKVLHKFEFSLEPKHPSETPDFASKLLDQVAEQSPVFVSKASQPSSGNLQRVLVPDIHLGKEGFQSEWGIERATERVLTVIDDFAKVGAQHDVERFCLPLGHDLLQVDRTFEPGSGRQGTVSTTTGGTVTATTDPWVTLFLAGTDLGERIVRRLLEVAPVDIEIIPGNHSEHSEIAIGAVLDAVFRDSPDVTVDLTDERERFYQWGVNSFMDTHGDTCPFNDLALNFATINGPLWGRTQWREVNTGHKHISKNRPVGLSTNEKNGCMVRISPSLSPQDGWHRRYHYHGMPGAESYIYNRERPGPFASFQRYF